MKTSEHSSQASTARDVNMRSVSFFLYICISFFIKGCVFRVLTDCTMNVNGFILLKIAFCAEVQGKSASAAAAMRASQKNKRKPFGFDIFLLGVPKENKVYCTTQVRVV